MNTKLRNRLCALVLAGALLVALAIAYVHFFLTRPTGTGPAGPAVSSERFGYVWTERTVHIVGIGDSITAGLGATSPAYSYFNRLIKNPLDEFADMELRSLSLVLPNLTATNFAISGSTSDQHLEIVHNRIPSADETVFGVVLITTGGNDLIHAYGRRPAQECAMYGATLEQAQGWIENYRQRLNTMLDTINGIFPGGCEIYLANIYDPTDGVGDAPSIFLPDWPDGLAIHAQYNQIIAHTAEQRENVFLVDLYRHFLGHGSHCRQFWRATYVPADPNYWFHENVEDPNNRGYDAIRRIFLNTILDNSQLIPR